MNSIPRELRTDLVDDGMGQSQFIETRIIQPVNGWNGAGQGQIRFILPKQGILQSDAYIKFQIQAGKAELFLPIIAGAYSPLDTATLYCGGYQIQQTRGLNHLLTLKEYYRTPHERDNKQSIRTGCFSGLMVDANQNPASQGMTANAPGHWGVDTGTDYIDEVIADSGGATVSNARLINTDYRITTSSTTTPEWRIYLAQLFPILYSNKMPLGLFEKELSIVIDLTPDDIRGERTCVTNGTVWNVADSKSNIINPTLHLDLEFYDDPIGSPSTMDKLKEILDRGEKLVFTDNAFIISQQGARANGVRSTTSVLLGLDHQVVRHLFLSTPHQQDYSTPANNTNGMALLGDYYSQGSTINNTLQLNINSQPVYPNELNSDNKIFNQLSQVYQTPFKANAATTSFFGQVNNDGFGVVPGGANGVLDLNAIRITNKTLEGISTCGDVTTSKTELMGNAHYYGINLAKDYSNKLGTGTSISRVPVELVYSDVGATTFIDAKRLLIWANCERVMTIVGGKIMVSGS